MSNISTLDRISDAIALSSKNSRPQFVGFLSSTEFSEIKSVLDHAKHCIFGGYTGAERVMVALLPEWCDQRDDIFPITPLTFSYRACDTLSHRDFLGAILALGIKRSTVGDILVEQGHAIVFLSSDIADYVISQLDKVGRVGVEIKKGIIGNLPGLSKKIDCTGTIASNRIDNVVSSLISTSRSKSHELIRDGFVVINSSTVQKPTVSVAVGDAISIRKYGKFTVTGVDKLSKKGKLILEWQKYI